MLKQLLKFTTVGGIAACVHLASVFLLVNLGLHPLIANVFAFCIAFSTSFLGHHHWTFASQKSVTRHALQRFFIVALLSLGLNEGLFYGFLTYFHLYYLVALSLVLLIVPMLTFIGSKYWAFANRIPSQPSS